MSTSTPVTLLSGGKTCVSLCAIAETPGDTAHVHDPAIRRKIAFVQQRWREDLDDATVLQLLQEHHMDEVAALQALFGVSPEPSRSTAPVKSVQQTMFAGMRHFYDECVQEFVRDNPQSEMLTQTFTKPEWWLTAEQQAFVKNQQVPPSQSASSRSLPPTTSSPPASEASAVTAAPTV